MERLSGEERRVHILQHVHQQGRITVAEICRMFGVSEATARRDLEVLAEHGLVQRVRGGAISLRPSLPEPPLSIRMQEQREAKRRIGRVAASLIQPGETVFLGSGSTVLEVARHLRQYPRLTVITNSLPVINLLAGATQITVIGLGGMFRHDELSFIGHITERALEEVRVEKVVVGIRGLSLEHGLTSDYPPEALTDRAIFHMGGQLILVADHTKLGVVAPIFVAALDVVDVLVTDNQAPRRFIEALEARGLRVYLA